MSLEHRPFRPAAGRPEQLDGSHTRIVLRIVGGMEIAGTVHLPPGLRTVDLLNRETEAFLPVTGATLTEGHQVEHMPFIAVNKTHIVTLREFGDVE